MERATNGAQIRREPRTHGAGSVGRSLDWEPWSVGDRPAGATRGPVECGRAARAPLPTTGSCRDRIGDGGRGDKTAHRQGRERPSAHGAAGERGVHWRLQHTDLKIASPNPLTSGECTVTLSVQFRGADGSGNITHRDRQRRAMLRGFARDRVGTRVDRSKRTRCGATCGDPGRRGEWLGGEVRRDCASL